ncbi:hypothetical protein TWF730_003170 [Orbilia blumenaviensis]|uniref:F-box domain-containing protein n=1 Tax=Orbilia blumenaviensis TaxID=1796055 RepID=A0AAV9U765_9PEZI
MTELDPGTLLPEIHKIERTRYIPSTSAANLGRKRPKRSRLVHSSKVTSRIEAGRKSLSSENAADPPIEDQKVEKATCPQNQSTPATSRSAVIFLPLEIHEKILEYLPYEEHFVLAQVCDAWMEVLQMDKFAVKRYRSLRMGKEAAQQRWYCEPTLSQRYQRATTSFLLYGQKLFLEIYRDEPATATLILLDRADTRILSREERVIKKRRDMVAGSCQVLPQNCKYVEIHNLALFERDTITFTGQGAEPKMQSSSGQGIYFTTIYLNAHDYSRIRNEVEVPSVFCSSNLTLKGLMGVIDRYIKKQVLDVYGDVCGCVALFERYSNSGASQPHGIMVNLLVLVVRPQEQHLYVQNEQGSYTARLKDPTAAESFNFGFSSYGFSAPPVPFRAPSKTSKKAMSEISGHSQLNESVHDKLFNAIPGEMLDLSISAASPNETEE